MTFRPALWPTLFTVPAFITLLVLGTWQVQRLAWKNDIVARIEQRMTQAAAPLPASGVDVDAMEYRRVSVTGTFLHEREVHIVATSVNGNPGYHVVTPLQRADGAGGVDGKVTSGDLVDFLRQDIQQRDVVPLATRLASDLEEPR